MSGLRNFALAGVGGLGAMVVGELLKAKAAGTVHKISILTRLSSGKEALEKFASSGANIIPVDYENKGALRQALVGVDIVISTLPLFALDVEFTVAEASKAAGAKLFVPSEYGLPVVTDRLVPRRVENREKLREMGFPYTLFFCGPWTDIMFAPFFFFDLEKGTATLGGDGNKLISATTRPDVARFIAYALTNLPIEKLEYRAFRMEGDRMSLNEVFKAYEAKTGKKVVITYKSVSDLEAAVASNPHDFASHLHLLFALGEGIVGTPDNDVYPNWNPTSMIDYLA
ncbi:NAD-P-binding protein [Artomyces pyxidatus]|uniref:NAD-P-binding protein n=1 Tax=Artomyces pyxidatus TaxID=48021 RepID=A0ACB8TGR4_9AGAM|nr:NAD-P-binding protein [Artomyces pyxidatus]